MVLLFFVSEVIARVNDRRRAARPRRLVLGDEAIAGYDATLRPSTRSTCPSGWARAR